ncbi:MAG: hypothetical protein JSW14_06895 [Candidatus Bathyarchaeum sp.]|nr:MAG: hypothetical protein JSW14_06895 [Candidatus Bathyarchaeum sp.]
MSRLRGLDFTTKIILVILVVIISFLLLFLVLSEVFVQDSTSGGGMMWHMMNPSPDYTVAKLLSLTLALVAGVLVTLWLKPTKTETAAVSKTDELEIIKRALSDDEKAVLDEVRRAGEITQDSLRFRLEWSKAKLSRILTNLDKMNIIQRERVGKTYNVFLTGKRPEQ